MDLLSISTWMGTASDGIPLPPLLAGDGTYHVPGIPTTPPPLNDKIKRLQQCLLIMDESGGAWAILMAQTFSYVWESAVQNGATLRTLEQPILNLTLWRDLTWLRNYW